MPDTALYDSLEQVLVTGAELFTGNTLTLTAALHEGKISFGDLMKSWSVSFIGNFIGSVLLAWLAVSSGVMAGVAGPLAVAKVKTSLSFAAVGDAPQNIFPCLSSKAE